MEPPQQGDLDIHRHIPDLVQEDRPAVGQFELARTAVPPGPSETPALIAEQLGLDQALRQCTAVDCDEGPPATGAGVMYGLGKELLARAALSGQENRGVVLGGDLGHAHCLPHGRRDADDVLESEMGFVAHNVVDPLVKAGQLLNLRHILLVAGALHRQGDGVLALSPLEGDGAVG